MRSRAVKASSISSISRRHSAGWTSRAARSRSPSERSTAWKPDYFAVFGVDTTNAGPRALIPFVAASAFELRHMSSDPAQGFHSMVLPTARVLPQLTLPDAVDPDDLGGVLAAKGVPHPENLGPRDGTVATSAKPKRKSRSPR